MLIVILIRDDKRIPKSVTGGLVPSRLLYLRSYIHLQNVTNKRFPLVLFWNAVCTGELFAVGIPGGRRGGITIS